MSLASCTDGTLQDTLKQSTRAKSWSIHFMEVVPMIISFLSSGGCFLTRTKSVCNKRFENRGPTSMYSIRRSMSSKMIRDKEDL